MITLSCKNSYKKEQWDMSTIELSRKYRKIKQPKGMTKSALSQKRRNQIT